MLYKYDMIKTFQIFFLDALTLRLILKDVACSKDIQVFIDLDKTLDVLGLLPGAEVKFSRIERCVSLNQGRVYCTWRVVSCVEIITYSDGRHAQNVM